MNYCPVWFLIQSGQTDRQKATHVSPPCKVHRWAQKTTLLSWPRPNLPVCPLAPQATAMQWVIHAKIYPPQNKTVRRNIFHPHLGNSPIVLTTSCQMNRLSVGSVWQSTCWVKGTNCLSCFYYPIRARIICSVVPEFWSAQDTRTHNTHARMGHHGNPRSGDGSQNLCQIMIGLFHIFCNLRASSPRLVRSTV